MGSCPHFTEQETKVLITRASARSQTQVFQKPKSLLFLPTLFPKLAQSEKSSEVLIKNTDAQDLYLAILLLLVWNRTWESVYFPHSLGSFGDLGSLGNIAHSIGCCLACMFLREAGRGMSTGRRRPASFSGIPLSLTLGCCPTNAMPT